MKIIQKLNVTYNNDLIHETTTRDEIIHVQVYMCPAGGSVFCAFLSTTVEEEHTFFLWNMAASLMDERSCQACWLC